MRRRAALLVGVLVLAACGWFEAAMRPFGLGSSLLTFSVAAGVLGASAVSALLSTSAPLSRAVISVDPAGRFRRLGVSAWVTAAGIVLGVELWQLFHRPRSLYPTLSSLANEVIGPGHRVARALAFVCWGACGLVISSRPRGCP